MKNKQKQLKIKEKKQVEALETLELVNQRVILNYATSHNEPQRATTSHNEPQRTTTTLNEPQRAQRTTTSHNETQ